MNIVLEGPDNAGKSTLAKIIGDTMGWPVVGSEGREKYAGEINDRIKRYFQDYQEKHIFDRHPVVSQGIYRMLHHKTAVDEALEEAFYDANPLLIYCRPPSIERGLDGHIAREDDDDEYLKTVEDNYRQLVQAYDDWALKHAFLLYRIGDDPTKIINAIYGVF